MVEFRYDTQLLIEGENLDEDIIYDYFTDHFQGDCLLAVGDESLIKIHFHSLVMNPLVLKKTFEYAISSRSSRTRIRHSQGSTFGLPQCHFTGVSSVSWFVQS